MYNSRDEKNSVVILICYVFYKWLNKLLVMYII